MNKLALIIKREYWTRVRKLSFWLATLLMPLGMFIFMLVIVFIFSYESDGLNIAVVDDAALTEQRDLKSSKTAEFTIESTSLEDALNTYEEKGFDGVLHIPKYDDIFNELKPAYYSTKNLGFTTQMSISSQIESRIRDERIRVSQIDPDLLKKLKPDVSITEINPRDKTDTGGEGRSAVATVLGGAMGFIMYIVVFVYGTMVMRSVMEEKTTRIVEVIVSSVKPFQLMMGKIIGVGLVGLTQVAIWGILIPIIMTVASLIIVAFVGPEAGAPDMSAMPNNPSMSPDEMQGMVEAVMTEITSLNWWMIIPSFILFFLGGYFLYASLFAAVGSAMGDDSGESGSLTLPITIPVILALYIMFAVVQNPNSDLAFWSSQFPFFSPIIMPARFAFDPPVWQVLLSLVTLLLTSTFFVWLSARIYRVGILRYGQKSGFKQIWSWIKGS